MSIKASRRQIYPQWSKNIATSTCFASLRYLQGSALWHHGNDLVTSDILDGKERKLLMTAQPKHRILVIGESHVRSYAASSIHNLGHSFNIQVMGNQILI